MVNIFGDNGSNSSVGLPKNMKLLQKVKVTKGKYEPHYDQIQESYKLGFTPYRVHHNKNGTFVSPVRIYDDSIYVLDDSGSFNIAHRTMENYNSHLVYAKEIDPTTDTDDAEVVGLIGPRGPPGHIGPQGKRGLTGLKGDEGPIGKRGPVGAIGPDGPQGEIGPQGVKGDPGLKGEKGDPGPKGPSGTSSSGVS